MSDGFLQRWRIRGRRLFRRRQQEQELAAELDFHFNQLVDEFRAQGMSEAEARRAAHREMGTVEAYREETRDAWRPAALADGWRAVMLAVRSLARTPGFTVLALLTLSLGIGANTAMFSVVSGVVLKPLPYAEPAALDSVFRRTESNPRGGFSPADFLDLRDAQNSPYESISGMAYQQVSFADPGQPAAYAEGMRVTANFFSLLGIQPALGRSFSDEETTPGNAQVVVLTDRLWRNEFGARPDIIGHVVRLNGERHTVIGVLPERFNEWRHLGWIDLFHPLALTPAQRADRSNAWIEILARRAPGIDAAGSNAFITNFGEQLARDHALLHAESSAYALPLNDFVTDAGTKVTGAMLLGLSGFVVLIACSNLANFLLARTMARAREFAVRSALGASRRQLLHPLLLEAAVLALGGGLLALVVASGCIDWLRVRSTGDNGEQVTFVLNWSVMAWAFLCSLATAIAFGIAPALFALRLNLNETLKSGARGTTGGRGPQRLRHLLIVGQFALAMVLLTGSGLFINGLAELNDRRAGWESENLVTGNFLLPAADYATPTAIDGFHTLVLEKLRALPGVASAGLAAHPPFFNWSESRRYWAEGLERPARGREPAAMVNVATPDYLATVGTPLLAGRDFDARDHADAEPTVIINAAFADALFGNNDPIGRRIAAVTEGDAVWATVIGVAADVRNSLPDAATVPYQIYLTMAQEPRARSEIAVRTNGVAPSTLVPTIRQLMAELDPDLPVRDLKSAEDRIARANYQLGVLRDMLTGFAVLGLALASIGIYGVIARTMAQRRSEFGIRLALGAQARDVTRIVLGTGVRLAFSGTLIGLLGGIGIGRLLAVGFPNMSLSNPWIIAAATTFLVSVALVACYLPARRAARINPVESLRAE